MESITFPENSGFFLITRRYSPEDHIFHSHRHEILKSRYFSEHPRAREFRIEEEPIFKGILIYVVSFGMFPSFFNFDFFTPKSRGGTNVWLFLSSCRGPCVGTLKDG
jgi:hypothetical protein